MSDEFVQLPKDLFDQTMTHFEELSSRLSAIEHEKTAALTKEAQAVFELDVAKQLLQLIKDGVVDSRDAVEKLAEYIADPTGLEVLTRAHGMGIALPTMGRAISDREHGGAFDKQDPAEQFMEKLEKIMDED